MSSEESSQITGETIKNICKLYAAYLCGHIYHEPEGKGSALARFPDEKIRLKRFGWEKNFLMTKRKQVWLGHFTGRSD